MTRKPVFGSVMQIICMLVVGLPMFLFTPQQAFAAAPNGTFRGNAYGVDVTADVGPTANGVRKVGLIGCTCIGTDGKTEVVNVNPIASAKLISAQGVTSTATTNRTSSEATAKTTSKVSGVSLLNGLITADAIEAVASVNATVGEFTTSEAGSKFVNLRIAGLAVDVNTPINTELNLPGFGSIVLREVITSNTGPTLRSVQVNMLHVKIAKNNLLNLPVGAEIVVGHAFVGFSRSTMNAVALGNATIVNAQAVVGPLQSSLKDVALVSTGCDGTNNRTITASVNSINIPGIVVSGLGRTTTIGGTVDGAIVTKSTARVETLSLLNGLIKADAINAVAQSSFRNGTYATSAQGTSFLNLSINNRQIAASVAPNTRIELAGIGYVILNQVIVNKASTKAVVTVNALQIYVLNNNNLGLPVGSQISVGHAYTYVMGY